MQGGKEILEHTALNRVIPSNPSPQSSDNPVEELVEEVLVPPRMVVTTRTRLSNQLSKAYMNLKRLMQQAQSRYMSAPDP